MSGKVGKFLIGAALIGAAFIPGLGAIAGIGLKAVFLSIGSSLALNSVLGPGNLQQKQGIALSGVTDTQAPLPVVYGKTKLGVRYVDKRTAGTDNKDLYLVCALCHGSQDGTGILQVHEIYFDDRLAMSADGVIQAPFAATGDSPAKLTVTKYLGSTSQTNDATLTSLFPAAWPATSDGVGVAYLILKLTFDPDVAYPTGEPQITVVVRGNKVKDPRNLAAAAAYSQNPACCLYDLLTSTVYGLGAAASEIDTASFAAMATYYDTTVTKNSTTGETGPLFACNGWLDCSQPVKDNIKTLLTSCRGILVYEGGKYRLFTRRVVSPTSFTLSEANIVGDWGFSVPGIGQAPNSIHGQYVEPGVGPLVANISTITFGGVDATQITTATAHGYVAGQTVHVYDCPGSGTAGNLDQGLSPYMLSTYTIAVGGIIDATNFVLKDSVLPVGTYATNSCRVTSENLPHAVATRIWPRTGTSNGYLTADNNYEVVQEVSLPFTSDAYSAEQILLVTLKEARAGTAITLTATEAALTLQVGDLVPLTHPTPGFVSKNFWVMGVMLDAGTGHVRLALLEYDSTAYTLDALNTIPTPPSTTLPNPFTCIGPDDITLTAGDNELAADADGSSRMYITANWTAAVEPFLDFYELQYRQGGSDTWLPVPDQNRVDTTGTIGPVSEGVGYDVRVRAVNTIGVASGWISDTITPQLDKSHRSGSFWIDDFTSQTPGRRWIPISLQSGATFVDVYDPDSVVGGKVGRAVGGVHYELKDSIPFNPNLLYVIRWRVRQLRDPSVGGSKAIVIGVNGLAQTPGQPGVFTYINTFGQDDVNNQHFVISVPDGIPAGRGWTDMYAYIKGFAGGKIPLVASQLSHSGLGSFSAANLTDGDTDPAKVGFDTNSAVAGAFLKADFGTDPTNWKVVVDARMHMDSDGSTAGWDLEFSDDATNWTKVNT